MSKSRFPPHSAHSPPGLPPPSGQTQTLPAAHESPYSLSSSPSLPLAHAAPAHGPPRTSHSPAAGPWHRPCPLLFPRWPHSCPPHLRFSARSSPPHGGLPDASLTCRPAPPLPASTFARGIYQPLNPCHRHAVFSGTCVSLRTRKYPGHRTLGTAPSLGTQQGSNCVVPLAPPQ